MSNPKPTANQLRFLNWELGAFMHFGIRSFYLGHSDWDGKDMPLEGYDPDSLDCEQWITTLKDVGMKYCVLTAKHHDGFANWPSAYTEYSIKNTPYKNGKGDVIAEYVAACRKYDMGVGIYYSPAQWGASAVTFDKETEYDDYFINQISELLSNYGKIDYLWFDGCGSGGHKYDTDRIIKAIRSLQPEIMIFGMWDPDTLWVGNEDGYASLDNTYYSVAGKFLPFECDCRTNDTWFFSEAPLYSLDRLIGMYYMSVGRGSNMLINIGPDNHGLLPEKSVKQITAFHNEIERRFAHPLENVSVKPLGDGKIEVDLDGWHMVNHLVIKENIENGSAIRGFKIYKDDKMLLYIGATVGHKAICRFPSVICGKLIVEVTDSEGEFKLDSIEAFYVKEV